MTDLETEQHRATWRVVAAVMPGSEFVSHHVELNDSDVCAVKFPIEVTLNPIGCRVCGDPPDLVGLTVKCRDLHEACACGRRFDEPKAKGCRCRKHVKEVQES